MTYSEIIERAILRAQELNPKLDLDRLRVVADASFFSVNSQVSEAFAARESHRELLRATHSLTFVSGDADLPNNVLKKYIEDATFISGAYRWSFRRYPQWLSGGDPRLALWTTEGETIKAKTSAPVTALSAAATFTAISSPAIPALADDEYLAPDDMLPEIMDTLTGLLLSTTSIDAVAEVV